MKNQKNYVARKDIYNMLIRLHARHNQTDQARGLFFEMQEWRYSYEICTFLLLCAFLAEIQLHQLVGAFVPGNLLMLEP